MLSFSRVKIALLFLATAETTHTMAECLKTYHLIPQQQSYEDLKIHEQYFHFRTYFFLFCLSMKEMAKDQSN